MNARVFVTLKNSVLDPQGKAVEGALNNMGFGTVQTVRQGKVFDLELDTTSAENAKREVTQMCEKLLANTVIENYSIELLE